MKTSAIFRTALLTAALVVGGASIATDAFARGHGDGGHSHGDGGHSHDSSASGGGGHSHNNSSGHSHSDGHNHSHSDGHSISISNGSSTPSGSAAGGDNSKDWAPVW
jgi:hypothetical protein